MPEAGAVGDIRFERRGAAGLVTLARPKALNALTHDMLLRLEAQLRNWETDDRIERVVIGGEGRAFCAGGDLMALYENRHDGLAMLPFFADEYRINAYVEAYPKPYVALIDGIVMGGGVGVSIHGSHRVATGNAVFAMPEVGIGFFPDVGGSHFLSRLPGSAGVWLGLTGMRIRWGDMLWTGLASHCVPASELDELTAALCASGETANILGRFHRPVPPETSDGDRILVDEVFAHESVAGIMSALETRQESSAFCGNALSRMRANSPTSMSVALRQIRSGATLSMQACMAMEYRIVARMLAGHDFYEGIRTVLIDKGDRPQWKPATVAEVTDAAISCYFEPLETGELQF